MLRKLLASLTILAVGGTVFATAAFAAAGAKTEVTLEGPNGDFAGELFSSTKSCLGDRTVNLYKQKGSEQSPSTDQVIGTDTSDRDGNHGEFSFGNTGFKKGKFYAKALKSPGCRAGYSPTIKP